jgi:hypothetical protein
MGVRAYDKAADPLCRTSPSTNGSDAAISPSAHRLSLEISDWLAEK